jgi:single-stranded-DNA-specific exonuclease
MLRAASPMANLPSSYSSPTESDLASDEYADVLDRLNHERKELDKSITEQALDMIATDEVMLARRSTVLYYDGWHKGVIGIVASRLIEYYFKPTIVLTLDGKATGSGRSVRGFDLYEAIYGVPRVSDTVRRAQIRRRTHYVPGQGAGLLRCF